MENILYKLEASTSIQQGKVYLGTTDGNFK